MTGLQETGGQPAPGTAELSIFTAAVHLRRRLREELRRTQQRQAISRYYHSQQSMKGRISGLKTAIRMLTREVIRDEVVTVAVSRKVATKKATRKVNDSQGRNGSDINHNRRPLDNSSGNPTPCAPTTRIVGPPIQLEDRQQTT